MFFSKIVTMSIHFVSLLFRVTMSIRFVSLLFRVVCVRAHQSFLCSRKCLMVGVTVPQQLLVLHALWKKLSFEK